jgi:hypothetical protein
MKPALTKEEWEDAHHVYAYGGIGKLTRGGTIVSIAKEDRHLIAALCLHEQSFGFTREDVRLLRYVRERIEHHRLDSVRTLIPQAEFDLLADLADRISDLLPPEEP